MYPGQDNHHLESWVVEKSAKECSGFSEVVDIHHGSSLQPKQEQWSVLFKTIPLQHIPSRFHDCLSIHKIPTISIGIAGALDTPPHFHRPFFGLPLLDTISLPIHLHCTFILSEDRRSIRHDEKGQVNLESQFNRWLLAKVVPSFYLQFLAGWNNTRPMKECPWWPKEAEKDWISRAVVKAMATILPESNELVCDSYSNHRIAPSKAHFLQPSCPGDLLQALLPDDLAILPPGFSSPPLPGVDSNYLTTILQHQAASIISMYKEGRITVGDVAAVTGFLNLSFPNSLGLPLLPLADGTLAPLSAEHTIFYCPPQQHETPQFPFPLHHFLHPEAAKEHAIYDSLQVRKLDNMAISRLIMANIPEQDTFSPSRALDLWLGELWDFLDNATEVSIEDLAFRRLPLIPTYSPEIPTRISFLELTRSKVLLIKPRKTVPLDACAALGMKLIRIADCGKKLREAIKSQKEQSTGIHHAIIGFFTDLPLEQIPHRFQRLSHELHSEFSQWFRKQLSGAYRSLSETEKAIVQHLPLWETVQTDPGPVRFVSASTAIVIPEGISPDVVRTPWATGSTAYVPADYLPSFMKEPVALSTFYTDHLSFPLVMSTVTSTYKSLLKEILRSPGPRPSILVPNANGRMSPPSELYLSSNATFANAFASQNRAFLHPDLRDLEQELCHGWGLISTVTAPSFEACALAIHQDINGADILSRALAVFRTYNAEMPRELFGNPSSQNALQDLRFIPRRVGSTHYGSIPTDSYHSLPDIVSPSEVADPKFVRVAWTQRAMCFEVPSPELRVVNNSAWEPTAPEVVRFPFLLPRLPLTIHFQIEHLRILSTRIAPNLQHNSELIEDLKATYLWLNDHESEAEGLLDYNQDKLFLNVDNPFSEWTWDSASELLLDDRDSSNPRPVRQFLRIYSGLLRAAGVKEIDHVSIPDDLPCEFSHETRLTRIRSSFNRMREADQLTDVIFIAEDGTEFAAHRVFLAAQSRHFETCFSLGWRESRDLEGKVEINVDHSQGCLEAVLGS